VQLAWLWTTWAILHTTKRHGGRVETAVAAHLACFASFMVLKRRDPA
jgi:hypothetical protein